MPKPPFPDKKYDIIYADPPWEYPGELVSGSNCERHYPTIPNKQLYELPVNTIAKTDCLLFIWIRSPMMPESLVAIEAWGFKYITVAFVWNKVVPVLGHYTLSQAELCLIAKQGKIPLPRGTQNERQWLQTETLTVRKGSHSVKPLQIQHRITEMFPTQAKIELFARPMEMTKMTGWHYWGNEV